MRGGYMPLFFYFFIFMFLFSFVQGFTTITFSYLGLPIALSFIAAVFLLGGVAFLFFRGYPLQTYALGMCVFVGVLAAFALLRGFTVSEPDVAEGIPAGALESYYDDAETLDGTGFFAFDMRATLDEDPTVTQPLGLFPGRTVPAAIELARLQTPGGQWNLVDASVRVSGDLNGQLDVGVPEGGLANPDALNFRTDVALREVVPFVLIEFPRTTTSVADRAQTFNVLVEAELIYPTITGAISTETITRDVTLVSPPADIYSYEAAYSGYLRSQDVINEFPGWYGLLAVMGFAAVGGVFMVRDGALKKPVGGPGLQIEVRELTGLQKLGLEAHTLDALKDDEIEGVEEGVLVGLVNAQSPAGRADIRSGDVILRFDGTAVKTPKGLQRLTAKKQRGDMSEVVLVRYGGEMTLMVKF